MPGLAALDGAAEAEEGPMETVSLDDSSNGPSEPAAPNASKKGLAAQDAQAALEPADAATAKNPPGDAPKDEYCRGVAVLYLAKALSPRTTNASALA